MLVSKTAGFRIDGRVFIFPCQFDGQQVVVSVHQRVVRMLFCKIMYGGGQWSEYMPDLFSADGSTGLPHILDELSPIYGEGHLATRA